MLKSCPYCGRIHDSRYDCGRKPKKEKNKGTEAHRVHQSNRWKEMSRKVRDRDGYLCRVCLTGKHGTMSRLNSERVSVHHIIPIEENPELAYDWDNCITLCAMHHEMAEAGEISRDELRSLVPPADDETSPRG